MAPVALRYLGVSFLTDGPCLLREVAPRRLGDPVALASLAALCGLAALAVRLWRRGAREPLVALGLFAAGLAPVSQVFVPLQNRMADRYLLVAVLGPALLLGWALAVLPARRALRRGAMVALLALAAASSARHAWRFADEPRLWLHALERAPNATLPRYQLAMIAQQRGDDVAAERWLREVLTLDAMRTASSPRAATNLTRILARTGRAPEAVGLLRVVVARFPDNPRALNNLAVLLHARGDTAEARGLFERLVARFPDYANGVAAYTARYGPPAGPPRRADAWGATRYDR
jgi:tetratricopeptide (TPR) repeat protein